MAYRFPECADCANHDTDPAICDGCEDGDHYEPLDEDYDLAQGVLHQIIRIKEIAA